MVVEDVSIARVEFIIYLDFWLEAMDSHGGRGPFFFCWHVKNFFCFIVFLYMSAGCVSTIRT